MAITVSTPTSPFRRGYGEYVSVPTAASTLYCPGDLIWLNSGVAAVASAFTWDTSLAVTQAAFRLRFLGVCMDYKLATDASTAPVLVCTRGVFSYPCAALGAAKHIGEFVGCAKDTDNNLRSQLLAMAATYDLGIGTVNQEAASGDTSLVVYLQSFLIYTGLSPATDS